MEIFNNLTLNYLNKLPLLNEIAKVFGVIVCNHLLELSILVDLFPLFQLPFSLIFKNSASVFWVPDYFKNKIRK